MNEPDLLIKSALNDAVQKVNEGMTPTAALKKVAGEFDLNPNYIQRTGEALNVALHYKHFKTASDRSVEFDIADIPTVVKEHLTPVEKTASQQNSEDYAETVEDSDVFNYSRMLSNPLYKRAFLEINDAPEINDSYATTFDAVYEKSANYIQKLEKDAELAEVDKVAAEIKLNSTFSTLVQEFNKDAAYRTAFEEFESQAFAKHGAAANPYLDLIHSTVKFAEERGVHDAGYMMFDTCKEAALFDELMTSATELVKTEKRAADVTELYQQEYDMLKTCRRELGNIAKQAGWKESLGITKGHKSGDNEYEYADEKFAHAEWARRTGKSSSKKDWEKAGKPGLKKKAAEDEVSEDPVIEAIKKKASDGTVKIAQEVDPVLEEALRKEAIFGFNSEPFDHFVNENVITHIGTGFNTAGQAKIRRPNLTLDNMERKLLLQELMLTDPILSKVNPTKVAKAFEQLLRLSPELSKEKEVVRAELRAMVASQALGKFDADLLTKLDSGMLKRRAMTHAFNSGDTEHFKY